MKIKMYQMFKILNVYKSVKELTVPAKVAYKFNKLCLSLNEDSKFYDEQLEKIIQKYADKTEDGTVKTSPDGGVQIKEGQVAAAQKEISNLDNLEIEVPDIYFNLDELDGLGLSIADFNAILPFIKEE